MNAIAVKTRGGATGWVPEVGFGDRLRRVRLTLGMNQAEFSATIGMKPAAYAHHELRAEQPRNATMIANSVELVHGVPAWWTLGLADPRETVDLSVTRRYGMGSTPGSSSAMITYAIQPSYVLAA